VTSGGRPRLADGPDDLLRQGYRETSNPLAAHRGHRNFEHPGTGDRLRHDRGRPGAPGHEGRDHYHRYNPGAASRHDQYLVKDGSACARGSEGSHLYPGD
jgi:hypothetical protein